jgi:hypothetical protein
MEERDVIRRLGQPDEIVRRDERMRSRAWICSTCRERTTYPGPVPIPAPCRRCGDIVFVVAHVDRPDV